jgi:hypothetical protein
MLRQNINELIQIIKPFQPKEFKPSSNNSRAQSTSPFNFSSWPFHFWRFPMKSTTPSPHMFTSPSEAQKLGVDVPAILPRATSFWAWGMKEMILQWPDVWGAHSTVAPSPEGHPCNWPALATTSAKVLLPPPFIISLLVQTEEEPPTAVDCKPPMGWHEGKILLPLLIGRQNKDTTFLISAAKLLHPLHSSPYGITIRPLRPPLPNSATSRNRPDLLEHLWGMNA